MEDKFNRRKYRSPVNGGRGGGGAGSKPSLAGSPARSSIGQVWVCPNHPADEFVRRSGSEQIPACACGAVRVLKSD
jgi:hypothetical protein